MATTTKKKTTSSSPSKSSSTRKKSTSSSASSYAKKQANSAASSRISEATGIKKSTVSKGLKKASKLSTGGKIAVGVCFIVGIAIGYIGVRVMQKDDQFALVNGTTYSLDVGDTYDANDIKNNVVCISYGQSALDTVFVVSSNLDTTKEGVYTVVYGSSNVKYKNVTLTQTITVTQVEDSYSEVE